LPWGERHEYNPPQGLTVRHLAASIIASSLASLLALACGSSPNDAAKPADAKTAPAAPNAADVKAPAPAPAPAPEPEPEPEPAPTPAADDYGKELCATIIPCFQQLEFSGSFSADVTSDIEPDGSVSAVSFTGQAPQPVQTCITDAIKGITLSPYNEKPGRVRCTKSGQLMGGTQMIMSDRTYELRDTGKAEGEAAPAHETKGG
jgi:pyruvate/2-oxoglutarate dehydrogenase complex dihydrolipoamide acyltransferase (E2) component